MEENKEPTPGYLGPNLEGHREPIPADAWAKIEAGLNKRKRGGLWFWLFGAVGVLLVLSTGMWFFIENQTDKEHATVALQPQPAMEKTAEGGHMAPQPKAAPGKSETLKPPPATKATLPEVISDAAEEQIVQKGKEPENEIVASKARKASTSPKLNALAATRAAETGRKVLKEKHQPAISLPVEAKAAATATKPHAEIVANNLPASEMVLSKSSKAMKPDRGEQTKESMGEIVERNFVDTNKKQPNVSGEDVKQANPPEKGAEAAARIPSGAQTAASATAVTDSLVQPLAPVLETKEIAAVPASDSVKKAEAKPIATADSAAARPDTAIKKTVRSDPFWLLSLNVGVMQQNVRFTPSSALLFSATDVATAYSARLVAGRLWPLFRSFYVGIDGSLHFIQQSVSARLPSPTEYSYGSDSLMFIAKTEYKTQQTFSRSTLILGLNARFQWKPQWSPVGVAGRYILVSYKFEWPHQFSDVFEVKNSREIGLWFPFRKRNQLSLDFQQLIWSSQSLPVPIENSGNNWIISLGFSRKW